MSRVVGPEGRERHDGPGGPDRPAPRARAALVLAVLLVAWEPLSLALTISGLVDELSTRGTGLAFILILRLLAAALGIAAGLSLLKTEPGAIAIAKASLIFSAIVDAVVWATPYTPNNRPPGDATIILVASVVYYAGWFVYLTRSSRVRATYEQE